MIKDKGNDYGSLGQAVVEQDLQSPLTILQQKTQVYKLTHKGGGLSPSFTDKAYISFTFGGKKIEDFGLIAVNVGDYLTRESPPEHEDHVSQYAMLHGQYYWGSHYTARQLVLSLATDGMTQQQLDSFKAWFSAGEIRELVLAEHPNRGIMARLDSAPQIELIPFKEYDTVLIAGNEHQVVRTFYKGQIQLDLIMDDPFWYARNNILGEVKLDEATGTLNFKNIWYDSNGRLISDLDADALRVIVEDNIPSGAMLDSDVRFSSDELLQYAQPYRYTLTNEPNYELGDNKLGTPIVDNSSDTYLTTKYRWSGAIAGPIFDKVYKDGQKIKVINSDWVQDKRQIQQTGSVTLSSSHKPYQHKIIYKFLPLKEGSTFKFKKNSRKCKLRIFSYPERNAPTGTLIATIANYEDENLETQLPSSCELEKDTFVCLYAECIDIDDADDNETFKLNDILLLDLTTFDESKYVEGANFNYFYSGTAPSYPELKFYVPIHFNNDGYIDSFRDIYNSNDTTYNTFALESYGKKYEMRLTNPSIFSSYNQVIALLKDSNTITMAISELIKKIRQTIMHPGVRDWIIGCINVYENSYEKIKNEDLIMVDSNMQQRLLQYMPYLFATAEEAGITQNQSEPEFNTQINKTIIQQSYYINGTANAISDEKKTFFVALNSTNTITVEATSSSPLYYQWQFSLDNQEWYVLFDNVKYQGTQTSALTIKKFSSDEGGLYYRCFISNNYKDNNLTTIPIQIFEKSKDAQIINEPENTFIDVYTYQASQTLEWEISNIKSYVVTLGNKSSQPTNVPKNTSPSTSQPTLDGCDVTRTIQKQESNILSDAESSYKITITISGFNDIYSNESKKIKITYTDLNNVSHDSQEITLNFKIPTLIVEHKSPEATSYTSLKSGDPFFTNWTSAFRIAYNDIYNNMTIYLQYKNPNSNTWINLDANSNTSDLFGTYTLSPSSYSNTNIYSLIWTASINTNNYKLRWCIKDGDNNGYIFPSDGYELITKSQDEITVNPVTGYEITRQGLCYAGDNITISPVHNNDTTASLFYQWQYKSKQQDAQWGNLQGENENSLQINNAQKVNAGYYRCRITRNDKTTDDQTQIELQVEPATEITVAPNNYNYQYDDTDVSNNTEVIATFSLQGNNIQSYQWQKKEGENGEPSKLIDDDNNINIVAESLSDEEEIITLTYKTNYGQINTQASQPYFSCKYTDKYGRQMQTDWVTINKIAVVWSDIEYTKMEINGPIWKWYYGNMKVVGQRVVAIQTIDSKEKQWKLSADGTLSGHPAPSSSSYYVPPEQYIPLPLNHNEVTYSVSGGGALTKEYEWQFSSQSKQKSEQIPVQNQTSILFSIDNVNTIYNKIKLTRKLSNNNNNFKKQLIIKYYDTSNEIIGDPIEYDLINTKSTQLIYPRSGYQSYNIYKITGQLLLNYTSTFKTTNKASEQCAYYLLGTAAELGEPFQEISGTLSIQLQGVKKETSSPKLQLFTFRNNAIQSTAAYSAPVINSKVEFNFISNIGEYKGKFKYNIIKWPSATLDEQAFNNPSAICLLSTLRQPSDKMLESTENVGEMLLINDLHFCQQNHFNKEGKVSTQLPNDLGLCYKLSYDGQTPLYGLDLKYKNLYL